MTGLILAALAAYRAARAIVTEQVAEPFRQRLTLWAYAENAPRWRPWVYDLFHCQHCLGHWFTAIALLAYRRRTLRPLVIWFAASAVQSLLVDASDAMETPG
jgi:hypothetical protein